MHIVSSKTIDNDLQYRKNVKSFPRMTFLNLTAFNYLFSTQETTALGKAIAGTMIPEHHKKHVASIPGFDSKDLSVYYRVKVRIDLFH